MARLLQSACVLLAITLGACGRGPDAMREEGAAQQDQSSGLPYPIPSAPLPSIPVKLPPRTFMFEYGESPVFNQLLDALTSAGIYTIRSRQTGMNRLSVYTKDYESAWAVIRKDPSLWERFAEYAPPPK